ncbi:MAG: fimbrillin family protein [Bacteroidales bacterium]
MKKAIFIATISAITFLSCTKQDNLNMTDRKIPLSVKAGISIEPSTKAIIAGTGFPDGATIGVQILKNSDGSIYETGASTNVQFAFSQAGSSWSTATAFNLTSTQGKVFAYYPYAAQGANDALFTTVPLTLPATSNTGLDTDYMYATPLTAAEELVSNSSGKNSASLSMNHALAQVSFVVYKENYPGAGSFTQFKIEDATGGTSWINVSKAAADDLAMDIVNGSITGGEKGILTRTFGVPVTLETVAPSADAATLRTQVNATTLVVPTVGMAASDIRFTFTIDGKSSTAANTSALSWEPGKQYIYKVKLSGTGLSISSVTVTEWTTVAVDDIDIN